MSSLLNDRTLCYEEYGIPYLFTFIVRFEMHGLLLDFVAYIVSLNLLFGLKTVNPCLVTSDDICERLCTVIWKLFKEHFRTLHAYLFLHICQQMGSQSSTNLSFFQIKLLHTSYLPSGVSCNSSIYAFLSCNHLGGRCWFRSTAMWPSVETNSHLNLLNQRITIE